jgi:hypothetical protein
MSLKNLLALTINENVALARDAGLNEADAIATLITQAAKQIAGIDDAAGRAAVLRMILASLPDQVASFRGEGAFAPAVAGAGTVQ